MGDTGRFRTYWHDATSPRGNAAEHSPESVSMVLRNARILQGYSLYEVAHAINVRLHHLETIEEGLFSALPPLVYAKGFVGAYAQFLGLNRSDIVARFCAEVSYRFPRQADDGCRSLPLNLDPLEDVHEKRMPSTALLAGAILLAVFGYGLWQFSSMDRRSVALDVPPLPERFQTVGGVGGVSPLAAAPTAPASSSASSVSSASSAASVSSGAFISSGDSGFSGESAPLAPPVSSAPIAIRAMADTRVQLRDTGGQRLASIVLRPGETYTIPADSVGLVLSTDQLDSLRVVVQGRDVPLAVRDGKPRATYHITLDPSRLLAGQAVF